MSTEDDGSKFENAFTNQLRHFDNELSEFRQFYTPTHIFCMVRHEANLIYISWMG